MISELRRIKPHGGVLAWLDGIGTAKLFLPAVAVGELQAGIERARPRHPVQAREIEAWLERALHEFDVLPMDGATFRLWAKLMVGRSESLYEDAMIAATALVHRLVVATRNVRDFEGFGVEVVNPFLQSRLRASSAPPSC